MTAWPPILTVAGAMRRMGAIQLVTFAEWAVILAVWRSWTADEPPAVPLTLLAQRTGSTTATVARHLAALHRKDLLPILPPAPDSSTVTGWEKMFAAADQALRLSTTADGRPPTPRLLTPAGSRTRRHQ